MQINEVLMNAEMDVQHTNMHTVYVLKPQSISSRRTPPYQPNHFISLSL